MKRILATAIVVASIASTTGCDNAEKRQEKYIAQGETYSAEGNLEKARISFKNALQINPENITAKLKFCEILERQGEYREAYGLYSSVLEKDPNNIEALERQGKILMMAGEIAKARGNAEKLQSLKGPDYVPALILKAGVLSKENNVVEALKLAQRAAQLDPKNAEASVLLAALYMRQTNYSEAESILREASIAHPKEEGFKGMLLDVLKKEGKTAEVETVLRSMVESDPNKLAFAMQLSKHLLQTGKSADALVVMENYVTAHRDEVQAKLVLVQLVDAAKSTDEGDKRLAEFIAQDKSAYALRFAQAQRLLMQKKNPEAIAVLEAIAKESGNDKDGLQANLMLAQYKNSEKDYDGAKALLEKILSINPSDLGALALRGEISAQQGRYGDAIGDLRAVVKERANDVRSTMMLASAYVSNKEPDLAIELLHKSVKANGNDSNARMMLGSLLVQKNDVDGAAAQYNAILEHKPDDAKSLAALAKLYQSANQADKLASIADKMLAQKDSMAAGFYYQGWLKAQSGKNDEARELFEKSLAITPSAVEPITAIVQSWLAQKQWQAAVKRVDASLATQPSNATLYNLKAESQIVGKELAAAEVSLKKAMEVNSKWWVPYRTASALRAMQKDSAGAQKYLETGIAATDNSPVLRMELAVLLQRIGKTDESIAVYRKMIDDGLTGDSVINNLAMLLASKSDTASLDAAHSYSEKLATSNNPLFLDTAGWVQYKRGDYQAALPILKKAVELAPKHPQIRYHLGIAYFRNNQLQEAKDNLSMALKDEGKFEGRDEAEQVLQQIQKG